MTMLVVTREGSQRESRSNRFGVWLPEAWRPVGAYRNQPFSNAVASNSCRQHLAVATIGSCQRPGPPIVFPP